MSLRDLEPKKIALIILFLLAVVIFGLLLYAFFFQKTAPLPPGDDAAQVDGDGQLVPSDDGLVIPDDQGATTDGLPARGTNTTDSTAATRANGSITHVSTLVTDPNRGAVLASNGIDLLYYNALDSRFYRITPDGKANALIDARFYEADNIAFNQARSKAVIEYPDGANVSYNFTTGEQVTLPQHWEEFQFSRQAESLAFKNIGINPENNWLALSNASGGQAQFVQAIGEESRNIDINWSPDNRVVATFIDATSDYSSGGEQQELIFIGKNQENYKSIFVEGYAYEGQWTESGKRMLYSVHNAASDFKPEIWVVNAQGNAAGSGRRNTGLQTWAHKCTVDGDDTAYCAVPTALEEGIGFVPELAAGTPDEFYKINLNTGVKTLLAQPDSNVTASNLQVSSDGKYLYFYDTTTGRLHKINLE